MMMLFLLLRGFVLREKIEIKHIFINMMKKSEGTIGHLQDIRKGPLERGTVKRKTSKCFLGP